MGFPRLIAWLALLAGCGEKAEDTGILVDWATCEAGDAGPGADACNAEWTCGDILLYVDCERNSESGEFDCTCHIGEGEGVLKEGVSPGCSDTSGVSADDANAICGWQLPS